MRFTVNKLKSALFCVLLIPLILDPQTAVTAGASALQLCIKSVIPSVLPFMLLGNAIAAEMYCWNLSLLDRILRIPKGAAGYFLIGIFCGYPVGAKLLHDASGRGQISIAEANRMSAFCNNASPAFIIGILASVFAHPIAGIIMWCIQICASMLTGILLPPVFSAPISMETPAPDKSSKNLMSDSLKAIASVCGWITIFSTILAYLKNIFLPGANPVANALICGIAELTNGLWALSSVYTKTTQYILCAILLSFGGLSVLMQTKSVAPNIHIPYYISARLLHSGLSGTLASISAFFMFREQDITFTNTALLICASILITMFLVFNKKVVAIRLKV